MNAIYVARGTKLAGRKLKNQMIIMTARDSVLSSLNELGTAIWDAADGVTPLDEIVERKICAEYEVNPTEALKDAQEFVQDLAEDGILIVSDQPIVTAQCGDKAVESHTTKAPDAGGKNA
jgi:Coenzyme PQQ synthesis protein D (PqqD)